MENTLVLILIIVLIILALLIFFLFKYRKCAKDKVLYFPHFPHISYDPTQILLWKKPEASLDEFKKYITRKFPDATTSNIKYCGDCDDSLVVVSNIDLNLFLAGQTPTPDPSRNPPPKLTGEEGPAFYSPNFPMEFKDKIEIIKERGKNKKPECSDSNQSFTFNFEPVTVAIFDSGIDASAFGGELYQNANHSCLGIGADEGWNFDGHTSNWNDDHIVHHGSVVGKFIVEQANKSMKNPVKILPVKIFSKNGTCLLSNVLCALQYAKNRGADIINASFGFYAPLALNDTDAGAAATLLFENFLKHYFKGSKILMIAAAGNLDNDNEESVYKSNDPVALRNLDNVSFYPASFAKTIPNIFAVTTISTETGKVSPHQNFSPSVVDIGVETDFVYDVDNDVYLFYNPYRAGETVEGSSFATPIATGTIAANYNLIKNVLTPVNKEAIRTILKNNGLVTTDVAPFDTLIKKGTIMTR